MAKTYVKVGTHWHESSGKAKHPFAAKTGHRIACTGHVAIVGETTATRPAELCKACANPGSATKATADRVAKRVAIAAAKKGK